MHKAFVSREPIEALLRWQAANLDDPMLLEAIDVPGNYGLLASMEYISPDRLVKDLFISDAETLTHRVHQELLEMGDDESGRYYSSLLTPMDGPKPEPFDVSGYLYLSLLTEAVLGFSKHAQKNRELVWEEEDAHANKQVVLSSALIGLYTEKLEEEVAKGRDCLRETLNSLKDEFFPGIRVETAGEVGTVHSLYTYLSICLNIATVVEEQHLENWFQLWGIYVELHTKLAALEVYTNKGTTNMEKTNV